MLESLTVKNLAVVEHAHAEFSPALNVITGETGAGKSVLMGALDLIAGARAESGIVREGAAEAEIEAKFSDATVRRTVTKDGRSRAWIDDESVSLAELREASRRKVDMHGPRANQTILEERFQREALDSFGGIAGSSAEAAYARAWKRRRAAEEKLGGLGDQDAVASEIDMLRFQTGELADAEVSEDDADLAERHAAAANSEEIVSAANEATELLGGDNSALSMVSEVRTRLARMAKHMPEAAGWQEDLDGIAAGVNELSKSIADAVSRIEVDPDEFAALDARLGLVRRLQRKYGEDLYGALEKKRERLAELENAGAVREKLEKELAETLEEVAQAGAKLSAMRSAGAKRLAAAVTGELRDLGFLQAKFSVATGRREADASGLDTVSYMFEPNPGEPARPLSAIASSGETARVMLALKCVLAAHDSTATLVFDEIDANVGGEAGKIVGEKMKALAATHQVIAITHLPQSAVFADRHFTVSKKVSGGRTRTEIREVEGRDRVAEIERMLGGERITSVTKKHAEELLEYGKKAE